MVNDASRDGAGDDGVDATAADESALHWCDEERSVTFASTEANQVAEIACAVAELEDTPGARLVVVMLCAIAASILLLIPVVIFAGMRDVPIGWGVPCAIVLVSMMTGLAIAFGRRREERMIDAVRKSMRAPAQRGMFGPTTVTITPRGVQRQNGLGTLFRPWTSIERTVRTPSSLAIFGVTPKEIVVRLAVAHFDDADEATAFFDLVERYCLEREITRPWCAGCGVVVVAEYERYTCPACAADGAPASLATPPVDGTEKPARTQLRLTILLLILFLIVIVLRLLT